MKKFFLCAFFFLLGMGVCYYVDHKTASTSEGTAATEASENTEESMRQTDITMVSYKHNADDYQATISLKNNTARVIKQVQFRIIYYDMSGHQIDYRDFTETTDIAPGLTKQIEVSRLGEVYDYYYYKSQKPFIFEERVTPYKIQYQLLGYKSK